MPGFNSTTLEAVTGGGEVEAIAKLAPQPEILELVGDQAAILVTPAGVEVEHLDLEQYEQRPTRAKGTVHPATVQAFQAYVARHYRAHDASVWVDAQKLRVVALLNDHSGDSPAGDHMVKGAQPGWGDHRAVLQLQTTTEWDHWLKLDGDLVSQTDFAQHVEDGYREITNPDAATMLEIAQSIEATSSGRFKSRQRLKDGNVEFTYDDTVTATAGATGKLEIPDKFELLLSPLVGEDVVAMTARVRFRIQSGQLVLGYQLDRPQDVLRAACDLIVETLRKNVEHVYLGRPE